MSGTPPLPDRRGGTTRPQWYPTVLDGRTGKVIWRTRDYEEGSSVHCGDEHTVLVAHGGTHLDGVDARTGTRRWTRPLAHEVDAVAPGPSCVDVQLRSGGHVGLNPATGASIACRGDASATAAARRMQDGWSSKARDGAVEATLSSPSASAHGVDLAVTRSGKHAWSKHLDVGAATYCAAFVRVTPDVVLVGALDPKASDELVWLGFSPSTGAQIYRRPHPWSRLMGISDSKLGRGVLYSSAGYRMTAMDPKTGTLLWQFGDR